MNSNFKRDGFLFLPQFIEKESALALAEDYMSHTTNWTGDAYGKIQMHSNSLYIGGGSTAAYSFIFRVDNQDKVYIRTNGTIWPQSDSTSDLGTSANRWANVYADTLHGDGSNITNLPASVPSYAGLLKHFCGC